MEEVVDFNDAGGTPDVFGTKSPLIKPLGLTGQEKADLIAFLESMSGPAIQERFPELPRYQTGDFPARIGVNLADTAVLPLEPASEQEGTPEPAARTGGSGLSFGNSNGGLKIDLSGS